MTKLSIVYHSISGHTAVLAENIFKGANSIPGMEVNLLEIKSDQISQSKWKDDSIIAILDASDAIIFGCPTFMGSVSSVFKAFMEWTFYPWLDQKWKGKIAAGFTNSASPSGDKLNTLIDIQIFASQMGMLWIPVGDLPTNNWSGGSTDDINQLGSWVGLMGQSKVDMGPENAPSGGDRTTALRFGMHIAKVTRHWKWKEKYEVERWNEGDFRKWNAKQREQAEGLKL